MKNSFEYHLRKVFEIAASLGVDNPLDKSKWREMIVAEKLGHKLFPKSSGGKNNDATYGADATDKKGKKVEYKTSTITESDYKKFLAGTLCKQYSAVYNGAYDNASIDRYENIDQYYCLFYREKLVLVVKYPTKTATDTLREVLRKKELRRGTGKKVTTNCNAVAYRIRNNEPEIGKTIFDIRNTKG